MSTTATSSIKSQRWVVMGVSGCGKSAIGGLLADRIGVPLIEGDAFHPQENIDKMAAGMPLNDGDRHGWLLILQEQVRAFAKRGEGMVLSCSALKRSYRDLLRVGDPDLIFVHLAGSRDVIANRMKSRPGHFMPVSLLDSQYRDLEPPSGDERVITLDIETAPPQMIEQILQSFHTQKRGQE